MACLLYTSPRPGFCTSGAVFTFFTPPTPRCGGKSGNSADSFTFHASHKLVAHHKGCLLYTSPEEARIARQIEELVHAANGHTLVLFTSYDQMGHVYEKLKGKLHLPVLQLRRNAQTYLQQFKKLPNAVLFASGACWEGVDFPGDMVSLLVIPRLPFPVPDPLGEEMCIRDSR